MISGRNRWLVAILGIVVMGGLVAALAFLSSSRQQIGRTTQAVAGATTPQSATFQLPAAKPAQQETVVTATQLDTATDTAVVPTLMPTEQATRTPMAEIAPTAHALSKQATTQLMPDRVTASGEAPSSTDSTGVVTTFVAENTLDGQIETAWRVAGNGTNQFLLFEFPTPVTLREIRLVPGYAKVDTNDGTNRFTQNRRVRRVRFEFSQGAPVEADFRDEPTLQPTVIDAVTTTYVRIVIIETTETAAVEGRDFTPISEVEMYGVQS